MAGNNSRTHHSMRNGLSFQTHIVRVSENILGLLWGEFFTDCVVLVVVESSSQVDLKFFPTFSPFSLKSSATGRALRALPALEIILFPIINFLRYQYYSFYSSKSSENSMSRRYVVAKVIKYTIHEVLVYQRQSNMYQNYILLKLK